MSTTGTRKDGEYERGMEDTADHMGGYDVCDLRVRDFVACSTTTARAQVVSVYKKKDGFFAVVRYIESADDGSAQFGKLATFETGELVRLDPHDVIEKTGYGGEYGPCDRCGEFHTLLTVVGGSARKGYTKVCAPCSAFLGTSAE